MDFRHVYFEEPLFWGLRCYILISWSLVLTAHATF